MAPRDDCSINRNHGVIAVFSACGPIVYCRAALNANKRCQSAWRGRRLPAGRHVPGQRLGRPALSTSNTAGMTAWSAGQPVSLMASWHDDDDPLCRTQPCRPAWRVPRHSGTFLWTPHQYHWVLPRKNGRWWRRRAMWTSARGCYDSLAASLELASAVARPLRQ